MTYWIYLRNYPPTNTGLNFLIDHGSGSGASGYFMDLYGTALYLTFDNAATRHSFSISAPLDGLNVNQWVFLSGAYTAATGTCSIYIDGVVYNNTCATPGTTLEYNSSSYLVFGTGNSAANASIADVQFYNTTLSPAQVKSLYSEGMHAPPIIQNKNNVGWWPLNGTLKDFSGNGNSGIGTGISMLNSTVWLKFNGGLPSGKTSIYMNFLPVQDSALNDGNIGEAPQLSSAYGEYDDGSKVFNFYDNFTTSQSQNGIWTSSLPYFIENNGLSVSSTSGWNTIRSAKWYAGVVLNAYVSTIFLISGAPYMGFFNITNGNVYDIVGLSTAGPYSTNDIGLNETLIIDTSNSNCKFYIPSVFVTAYPPSGIMPPATFGNVQ